MQGNESNMSNNAGIKGEQLTLDKARAAIRYPEEKKREVVKHMLDRDLSPYEVAKKTGINVNTIRAWRQRYQDKVNANGGNSTLASGGNMVEKTRAENIRLRAYVHKLEKLVTKFALSKELVDDAV